MADLKSFINTSSDRIKSAMGVPVDRIKTIQGSLLNPFIAEYQAVYDAMTVKPSDEDALIQNRMLKKLKDGGYFAKAELLDVFATHTGGSLLNWKNPAAFVPTLINAPVFTAYKGYIGDYTNYRSVNLNFNPAADGTLIDKDNMAAVIGCQTDLKFNVNDFGGSDGVRAFTILSRYNDDGAYVIANDGINDSFFGDNSKAHYCISRGNSATFDFYRNLGNHTFTRASIGLPNVNLFCCASNANGANSRGSNRIISYAFVFSYLTKFEVADVMAIMEEYLDAYGNGLYVNDTDQPVTGQYNRKGVVLDDTSINPYNSLGEPNVLYTETDSVIVGNPCFQMWYSANLATNGFVTKMNYAESKTGLPGTWQRYSGNPILAASKSYMFKEGSTYYLFTHSGNGLSIWSGTSPISLTLFKDNIIPVGTTPGTWDYGMAVQNICVIKDGATYYLLYEMQAYGTTLYKLGLATSTDLITWTKYENNPVLDATPGSVSGPMLYKNTVDGKYYLWTHNAATGVLPTDGYKYVSDDLHSFTLLKANEFPRYEVSDGPNNREGQIDDLSVLEVGGKTYVFYGSCYSQTPVIKNIKMAIVDKSINDAATFV